ncbi:hypothetical protein M2333_001469 [Sphingobium sp. B11D3B]|uniref:hypothetical protein n=2 Tax=Sphingobium TaxID=165695 RepID=UPI002226919F|nr:hypothetical protein [Sphingobium sp. B11D3B]MCW2388423.1 hypothetical protein [Sphingobium sp. B11D3B]
MGASQAVEAEQRVAGPELSRMVRMEQVQLAQLSIEQRVIIRIPTMPAQPRTAAPAPPVIQWKEGRGPRCLPLNLIRAAVVTHADGVTMVVSNTERYRAHLGRACRAADFYSGFYISPDKDGVLCAGRDMLHARNGSACEIERFSRLTPQVVHAEPDDEPRRARSDR